MKTWDSPPPPNLECPLPPQAIPLTTKIDAILTENQKVISQLATVQNAFLKFISVTNANHNNCKIAITITYLIHV